MSATTAERVSAGVIFDLDGVLVETAALHRGIWLDYVATSPYPQLRAAAPSRVGHRAIEVLEDVLGDTLSRTEREEIVSGLHDRFLDHARENGPFLVPGALELVDALAGRVPLAIATNSVPEAVPLALGPLHARFDAIVSSVECSRGKPDGEIYALAASRLGVPPEACIGIEDTTVGVLAVRAAGCFVAAVAGTERASALLAGGASVVARDLRSLSGWLLYTFDRTLVASASG